METAIQTEAVASHIYYERKFHIEHELAQLKLAEAMSIKPQARIIISIPSL